MGAVGNVLGPFGGEANHSSFIPPRWPLSTTHSPLPFRRSVYTILNSCQLVYKNAVRFRAKSFVGRTLRRRRTFHALNGFSSAERHRGDANPCPTSTWGIGRNSS
jgi:hypothetical protein